MSNKFYFSRESINHPAYAEIYVVRGACNPEQAAEILFNRYVEVTYFYPSTRGGIANAIQLRNSLNRIRHVPKSELDADRKRLRRELDRMLAGCYANSAIRGVREVEILPVQNKAALVFARNNLGDSVERFIESSLH